MNDFLALDISGSGMRAQRMRMRVITENLANQHVTGPDGPYQRKDTILQSVPVQSFDDQLIQAIGGLEGETPPITTHDKVEVAEVRPDEADPILVHDPNPPHADPVLVYERRLSDHLLHLPYPPSGSPKPGLAL